jgi:hypothetical protein
MGDGAVSHSRGEWGSKGSGGLTETLGQGLAAPALYSSCEAQAEARDDDGGPDDEGPGEPDGTDFRRTATSLADHDSVQPNFVRKTATGKFAKFTKTQVAARAASLEQLEEAWKCLGTPSERLGYDLRCQEHRTSWMLESKYNDALEVEKEARARSLAQGVATRKKNEALFQAEEVQPLLESIAHLTTPGTHGHVTNKWKLAVGKCARLLVEQGNTKPVATITRVVREASSPGKWDGKVDCKYTNLKQRVKRHILGFNKGELNFAQKTLMPRELSLWMNCHESRPNARGKLVLSQGKSYRTAGKLNTRRSKHESNYAACSTSTSTKMG